MISWLFGIFRPKVELESPMTTVEYKVRVTTADGYADLFLDKDKETFVPRVDDTLVVTRCVLKPDAPVIEADVVEVVYDPVTEVVTVYAETDLDFEDGFKIDCLVESAEEDGWGLEGSVEYHGCCKGLCPCDVKGTDIEVKS